MRQFRVIPAILAHSEKEFRKKVGRVRPLGAMVQVDVMDGEFVDNTTWADPKLVPEILGDLPFEVHLMVMHPERHIAPWLQAGAQRIWFHIESTTDHAGVMATAGGEVRKLGVAIDPETPVSTLNSTFLHLKQGLVMGVNPGWSGQAFRPETLEHLKTMRERCPDAVLCVDGGVSLKNVAMLREAGADEVVAGSALTDAADPRKAYEQFMG
jgi:ribulose-phosphate 3-epimerase